jgi:hypothetical protein
MFKKTVNFSDLKTDPSEVSELKNDEVLQVFHRGHEVKVIMTQNHFFNLMARLEKLENSGMTSKYDVEELLTEFDDKLKQVNALLGKSNLIKKTGTK